MAVMSTPSGPEFTGPSVRRWTWPTAGRSRRGLGRTGAGARTECRLLGATTSLRSVMEEVDSDGGHRVRLIGGGTIPAQAPAAVLCMQRLRASQTRLPKRAPGRTAVNLPITKVHINGFAVSDCLIDTGAAANLIDSRVFSVVAPSAKLEPPARLVSASGHSLNALGTCCLSVDVLGTGETLTEVDFVVVHNLTHDVVLGVAVFVC